MGYVENSVILKMLDLCTSKYVKIIKKYSIIRKKMVCISAELCIYICLAMVTEIRGNSN